MCNHTLKSLLISLSAGSFPFKISIRKFMAYEQINRPAKLAFLEGWSESFFNGDSAKIVTVYILACIHKLQEVYIWKVWEHLWIKTALKALMLSINILYNYQHHLTIISNYLIIPSINANDERYGFWCQFLHLVFYPKHHIFNEWYSVKVYK